jgi:curved DNA-binding protein CbpA
METARLRPFSTFELKPFLWVSSDEFSQIQKKYLTLSRAHHPDRIAQDDEAAQSKAEEISSRINYDFSLLKDFWKLVEVVLAEGLKNATCPVRKTQSSPPELAEDYFELQEKLSDLPRGAREATELLNTFKSKVKAILAQKEKSVTEFAARFPFQGFGASTAPWKDSDLLKLQDLLEQVRYYRSFLRDIDQKILKF